MWFRNKNWLVVLQQVQLLKTDNFLLPVINIIYKNEYINDNIFDNNSFIETNTDNIDKPYISNKL